MSWEHKHLHPVVTYIREPAHPTFTYVSPSAEAQFHLSAATLPDIAAWLAHVHPADQQAVREAYASGTGYRLTYRVTLPNANVRWIQDAATSAPDDTLHGCWVDISHQKETEVDLRQQLHFFEQTVAGTNAIIAIQDTDHRYTWVYNGIFSEDEALGKNDFELVGEPLASQVYVTKQQVMDTQKPIIEDAHITMNGKDHFFQSTYQPHYDLDGALAGVRMLSIDVTELRVVQQKLAQQAKLLARSNQDLERFAYAASHDLQEPLRAITGYLNLLRDIYADDLDDEAVEFIEEAVSGAERMGTLIRGLLDYSRINRRSQPLQPFALADAVTDAIANLSVALQETDTSITVAELPTVIADRVQLTRVFQNLIGNALKFSGDQPPEIHISATETEAGWRCSVRDQGIGIDPRYHERIFDIFQRLHARDEIDGTGIGLALCRRIIERHNGRIWVESAVGEGATFQFTLPHIAGEDA